MVLKTKKLVECARKDVMWAADGGKKSAGMEVDASEGRGGVNGEKDGRRERRRCGFQEADAGKKVDSKVSIMRSKKWKKRKSFGVRKTDMKQDPREPSAGERLEHEKHICLSGAGAGIA